MLPKSRVQIGTRKTGNNRGSTHINIESFVLPKMATVDQAGNEKLPTWLPRGGELMAIAGVGVCLHCEAVVNVHWSRCAVCDQPIEARRDQPAGEPVIANTNAPLGNAQQAFNLNSGSIPKIPPMRHTLFEPGHVVTIHSPMVGIFKTEVLRDNGGVLWVWHPFIHREVAVPNDWIISEETSCQ